jgi:hypothetical protein
MYDLPNNKADAQLTELLALTLGFKVKRDYDKDQLITLVSIIPSILKYKGSEKAIKLAGEALLRTSGALGRFEITVSDNVLKILLPKNLVDIALFTDLLPYIIPAGMTCKIVRKIELSEEVDTKVGFSSNQTMQMVNDFLYSVDGVSHDESYGLASLYDSDVSKTDSFTNFRNISGEPEVVTGLLDNTVIPYIEKQNIVNQGKKGTN